MKKLYSTPKTDVCVVETSILCSSGDPKGGGIIPPIGKDSGSWA
jgi:hypothetical protein